jgi:glucosamine-6-phosphate isomerase
MHCVSTARNTQVGKICAQKESDRNIDRRGSNTFTMRMIIRDDSDKVGDYVADYVCQRINDFKPTENNPFVLGLPTGSTPIKTYERLVKYYEEGKLSFEYVVTFNMDEYCNISHKHPESYHYFMWKHLFGKVNIKPKNVNILDGNAPDLQKECSRYEEKIFAYGGIELFLAGIGPDGHIAFNEPGSSLKSRTRLKTLAYETIIANSRFFDNDVNKVPKMALTVGVQTVMDAREVIVIITGAHKAIALSKCIEEGISHMWTVSCIQMHPRAMIVVDNDATLELRVKTVNYFKGLEDTMTKLKIQPVGDVQSTSTRLSPRGAPSDTGNIRKRIKLNDDSISPTV